MSWRKILKRLNNGLLLVIFLSLIPAFLFPVEISSDNYTVDLLENSGRFKLFWDNDDIRVPLFSIEDPETSTFSVYEDDALYSLGSSVKFKKTFNSTDKSGVFIWRSRKLIVRQEISINENDHVSLTFSISNTSENAVNTGMRIVLDSLYEGDNRFLFFTNESRQVVNVEYEPDIKGSFGYCIIGPYNTDSEKALMIYPLKTSPDRLVAGNWSRLDQADFSYRTVNGRNFNNAPYSTNDSALMMLYSPRNILPGNTLVISLALKAVNTGNSVNSIAVPEEEPAPLPEEEQKADDSVSPEEEPEQDIEPEEPEISSPEPEISSGSDKTFISQSLAKIGRIKSIIDSLSNPGMLNEETLTKLETMIEELEQLSDDEDTE